MSTQAAKVEKTQEPKVKSEVPEKPLQTTKVRVGINRLLRTGDYENITVVMEFEDEIRWTTIDERRSKTEKLAALMTEEYLRTQSQVCTELGIEEKRAWRKAPKNPPRSNVGDELLA